MATYRVSAAAENWNGNRNLEVMWLIEGLRPTYTTIITDFRKLIAKP
jgi:hypothetical protein